MIEPVSDRVASQLSVILTNLRLRLPCALSVSWVRGEVLGLGLTTCLDLDTRAQAMLDRVLRPSFPRNVARGSGTSEMAG